MDKDKIVKFPKKKEEVKEDDIPSCYDAMCTMCGSTEWNIEVSNRSNVFIEAFMCSQCRYRIELGLEIVFKDKKGDDS